MNHTSKTQRKETQLPPDLKAQVGVEVDPELLLAGLLWLLMPHGELVNAAVAPTAFDAAVTQHVDLPDRVNWPAYHRCMVIMQGNIPYVYIPKERLPDFLRERYEAVQPLQELPTNAPE